MKYLKNVVIAASLVASLSAEAQQPKEPKKPPKVDRVSETNPVAEFKKRNKVVKSVRWRNGNIMRIEKRDGTLEDYNLNDENAQKKAEQLYGALPAAPPPPPKVDISKFTPPPPPPPKKQKGA